MTFQGVSRADEPFYYAPGGIALSGYDAVSYFEAHGPVRGGTRVVITGLRFADGCKVRIGDAEVVLTHRMVADRILPAAARAIVGIGSIPVDL